VFELDKGGHHDHLVCTHCGRVEEFINTEIEARQARVAESRGFKVIGHSLRLYGECTNCPSHRPED
jgi:Fur family ferric uptake transcriptional regulator